MQQKNIEKNHIITTNLFQFFTFVCYDDKKKVDCLYDLS